MNKRVPGQIPDITKVLLVDDHGVVRQGLRTILEKTQDVTVVGEAASCQEGIEQIEAVQPDVILMDIRVGEGDGLKAAKQIKERWPDIHIIMVTGYASELYVPEAIDVRASGFITKDCSKELLISTIKAVVHGCSVWNEELLYKAVRSISRMSKSTSALHSDFTEREILALSFLATGLSNKEIGLKLGTSEMNVKKIVQKIMSKLGVSNRTQIALAASRLGL